MDLRRCDATPAAKWFLTVSGILRKESDQILLILTKFLLEESRRVPATLPVVGSRRVPATLPVVGCVGLTLFRRLLKTANQSEATPNPPQILEFLAVPDGR